MSKPNEIEMRKAQHIQTIMEFDVDFKGVSTGFERYKFIHRALPEVNLDELNTSVEFLNKPLSIPLIISSMTGGWAGDRQTASVINKCLARAAQSFGIGMGVGSQRAAIENPDLVDTYYVRDVAPDILLFANLGAIQLNYGYGIDEYKRAVDMIEADALMLHLNALQEYFQPHGDTNWKGLVKKIEHLCKEISVPVIAKEVGWGISHATAKILLDAGIAAIDVGGAGGTSWSEVEKHNTVGIKREVAEAFINWGIPTSDSIIATRQATGDSFPIIASGGIRSGIDIAKALALGANLTGMAGPFLRAAWDGSTGVVERLESITELLKVVMFVTGSENIQMLREGEHIYRIQ